jgi:hypothetical protein
MLAALLPVGLGLDYLRDQPKRLAAVGVDDVLAGAARMLAPADLVTVLLGDAEKISAPVGVLGAVEVTGTDDL